MAQNFPLIPAFLGISVQGDLGPWTFYTNKRGKIVFYPQAPPLRPASFAQRATRNRMLVAAWQWRQLPGSQRSNWALACKRAHLECVGFGLWFWFSQRRDIGSLATIEMQSGVPLLTDEAKNVLQI